MDTATRRYLKVVDSLGSSLNRRYGWQAEVARRLGVDRSLVSRLVSGERTSVGAEAQQRAVERLGLQADYFTAAAEPDALALLGAMFSRAASEKPGDGRFQSWEESGRLAREVFASLEEGPLTEEKALAMRTLAQQVLTSPLPAAARKLKDLLAKSDPPQGEVAAAFGVLAGLILQARLSEGGRS
jgi:transcriptional regulator with XRE-family HTH domain